MYKESKPNKEDSSKRLWICLLTVTTWQSQLCKTQHGGYVPRAQTAIAYDQTISARLQSQTATPGGLPWQSCHGDILMLPILTRTRACSIVCYYM